MLHSAADVDSIMLRDDAQHRLVTIGDMLAIFLFDVLSYLLFFDTVYFLAGRAAGALKYAFYTFI